MMPRGGGTIVGLCDVDLNSLGRRAEKFPGARRYRDFRKDARGKWVPPSTPSPSPRPDHVHGVAAAMAMKMGKHAALPEALAQTVL